MSVYALLCIACIQVVQHIMRKLQKIIFILSILIFTSCKKEMTDVEFEKNVMTEFF